MTSVIIGYTVMYESVDGRTRDISLGQSTDNFFCQNCVNSPPILSDSFCNTSDLAEETFSSNLNVSSSLSCLSFIETTTNQSHNHAFQESGDNESHDINND